MTDWPAWATEDVDIQAPEAGWQQAGDLERLRLDVSLGDWLVCPVEHVGSTSVPGLPAKPIVDLQGAVDDLGCAGDIAAALAPAGWHYVPPELDGRPWRRFFVKVADGRRVARLHLMRQDEPRWGEQLLFRDALRRDPELVARYAELKRTLAAQYAEDREAYTAGKSDFVASVLRASPS